MRASHAIPVVVAAVAGLPALGQVEAPAARPSTPIDPASCTTAGCHDDITRRTELHGPVSVNACAACHTTTSIEKHTYTLARQGPDLCTFCHDVDVAGAAVVHEPLTTGRCTGCHDPHGGADRTFLKAASANELCRTCHEDVPGANRHVHGPVAAGACTVCHAPHASPFAALLAAEPSDVCIGCHVEVATRLETSSHVHRPARGECLACHDAHASDYKMMLVGEPVEMCLDCHETILDTVELATTQHAAVTTDRACLNCHEAHAADRPRLLLSNEMDLCLQCHDQEIAVPDGHAIGNIKQVIDAAGSLHGPVAQGECGECHEVHGGDHFRMLVEDYPPGFYAPFKVERYALCFSCHDEDLVYDETTTSLTDFRNGDQNLHYLHVNRSKKGRTCRACHATHASGNAKHIRDAVPFGPSGWMLPLRYEPLEEGGRCAPGCHVPFEYNRVDPVDYQAAQRSAVRAPVAGGDALPPTLPGGSP